MAIKHGYSTDGVNFTVRTNPVLETGSDSAAWDHSKAETPTRSNFYFRSFFFLL